MTSPGPEGGAGKPAIMEKKNLMQLLADAITYKSPLRDVDLILRCGGDVNSAVNRGLRPLHYAVYVDYVDCVRLLIERGADVNATDDIGYTPIHLCARKGNIESMRVLIEEGATVDFMTGEEGRAEVEEKSRALGYLTIEPLNLAIENNHVDCLRLLLDHGARPDHKYFMGYEINLVPLDHLDCLRILLQYGADPNVFNRCGVSPLMRACRQQNLPAARMLINNGALVDLQCPPRFDQKTALHFAVTSGNAALVHLLLRHHASPARPDAYKYTALHAAVACDRPDMCEMLLRWGAKVDERSDESMTPLMLACATRGLSRQHELVQLLLEKGADVNANSGYLTYTSPAYLTSLVEYLRNMESDVTLPLLQTLVRYGANVHFTGAATRVRVQDPHGVLNYLKHVKDRPEIYGLLVRTARRFDADAIRGYPHLSGAQKEELQFLARTPPSLKHCTRLVLREWLGRSLPVKVALLPVPEIIRNFVLGA
ncbi:ankyrin repeat and SOCS box protein 16-like [Babylonia areolata]|uniref:ankyrin repeat and SOCS box protein 16-like n=1 Tax=Babylonia areolata TaxID=304850 RepID=UPI003FCFD9B7